MVPTTRHLLWLSAFAVLASCDYTSLQIGAWDRPRAAIIRDHVYLEGGNPSIGTWNGATWTIGPSITVSNGVLFNLSLHQPFNVSDKQAPALFTSMIETEVGNYYVDGAMFADYNEFYAWGGMPLSTADVTFRTVNDIFYDLPPGKDPNSAGVANTNFAPDNGAFLPATNGAGASAPSEKLGFYFGGYYSANGTSYSYFKQPTDELPYLVQVDMKDEGAAYFSTPAVDNTSAPWRAEAGLVWVPTSTQGILVAIGGVTNPADKHYGVGTNNASLPFLKEFPIYDIGTSNWTSQAINAGSPFPDGPLAQFCTVVASAPDGSHHDIFVYGGWNGSTGGKPQAEVWILTIPSFTWVKANSSDTARQGHVCVQPYADEMIVIGGTGQGGGSLTTEKSVDVFNLSSWEWTGVYDPTVDEPYRPNEAVLSVITATPTASGMVTAVARLFETKYDTSSISTFSFSATSTTTPSSNATNSATPPPGKHHNRAWVVPVAVTVSVVGGLVILGALFFFCCYSRIRKQRQQHNQQETAEAGHRKSMLLPWLWATHNAGAPKDVGSDTITEVEPTVPQELEGGGSKWYDGNESRRNERWSASTQVRSPRADYDGPVEAQGTAVNEMHAQSKSINPDGIDYNIRNMALYPPSVVSGGNASHEHSTSISQVDGSEEAPASPRTTSATVPSSPRGFTTIPEGNVPSADTYPFAATLGPLDPAPPVSPMGRQQQRPGHHRHNSSVSSGMSMTMPSPDLDQSALPARPRGARSVSGDEHDVEEDPHSRTF
ncbi:hypothetical protein LTR10_021042 [Elasticomyces elasticus]|uniref:Uncharacterized protein n=1 Tax=Exophiala sideris TaxID=1016849 RepID=A0ABR0J9P9_9EURO|nr:hypothetical protein LTR10_021042 [Elasticomyces elasticus]KAK5027762.1 hypothetical protein LTS07_006637 [Exophiala sideris]KAK5037648.1 hypothetical protein LTR13_004807 [Exophiala sideris]KAK5059310.1 hypothetical protein LTR69_006600 [Exophiala sideris]KAK5183144.1 hypothetical protein LTR44_004855 [Eurotiomycetes sp. CCFEE 6388]